MEAQKDIQLSQKMILGQKNILKVLRSSEFGLYLGSGDGYEVLLPNAYVTDTMQEDMLVEVLVYTDSEDRMVATTDTPKAYVGEIAYLTAVDRTNFGTFFDIGLKKDLLVPRAAQKGSYTVGENYLVRISFDERTHRLIGVGNFKSFMKKAPKSLIKENPVTIIVDEQTPMGYKVYINNLYEGMLFKNEIFQNIEPGKKYQAYVKNVRFDGKVDVSLQAKVEDQLAVDEEKILNYLNAHEGKMPINTKSDAQLIQNRFGLSKKAFKRALNALKSQEKIEISENGSFLK